MDRKKNGYTLSDIFEPEHQNLCEQKSTLIKVKCVAGSTLYKSIIQDLTRQ